MCILIAQTTLTELLHRISTLERTNRVQEEENRWLRGSLEERGARINALTQQKRLIESKTHQIVKELARQGFHANHNSHTGLERPWVANQLRVAVYFAQDQCGRLADLLKQSKAQLQLLDACVHSGVCSPETQKANPVLHECIEASRSKAEHDIAALESLKSLADELSIVFNK